MPERQCLNLPELLTNLGEPRAQLVFEDNYFRREQRTVEPNPDISIDILTDCLKEPETCFHYISINFAKAKELWFTAGQSPNLAKSGGLLVRTPDEQRLLWLGAQPAARSYDSHGNIKDEKELSFKAQCAADSVELGLHIERQSRVQFTVVVFAGNYEGFLEQINVTSAIEDRPVARGFWFDYKGIENVWDYLANGAVYHPLKREYNKRWQCQQCAHGLFYYLDFLAGRSGKKLYKIFCDIIAYSVMLSLPADGRWRHGTWTDIMESQMRFQTDGIHLLLSYYEKTQRAIFLAKARLAADFLLTVVDRLPQGGLWFLHDTLETNLEDCKLKYKRLIPSNAFGKSVSNTLCLNTHIWTLTVLHRLTRLTPEEKYEDCFEKGLSALQRVLTTKPAGMLYSPVYWLRDVFVRASLKTQNSLVKRAQLRYDNALRYSVLPCLKSKFPRLYMPNGFIERDLSYSCLSLNYHIINIRDLLTLYKQTQKSWLLKIIKKSMSYTVKSKFVEHFALYDRRAAMFWGLLALYSATIDGEYDELLPLYKSYFEKMNFPLFVDSEAYPFLASR